MNKNKNIEQQRVKWGSHGTRVNHTWSSLKRDEMSPSPTANRSFLHGSGKAALISNKVVYATLDSLALKRTRLPLQLLPVESDNVVDKTEKSDKEKRVVNGKNSTKRPSYKVCQYWYKYYLFIFIGRPWRNSFTLKKNSTICKF